MNYPFKSHPNNSWISLVTVSYINPLTCSCDPLNDQTMPLSTSQSWDPTGEPLKCVVVVKWTHGTENYSILRMLISSQSQTLKGSKDLSQSHRVRHDAILFTRPTLLLQGLSLHIKKHSQKRGPFLLVLGWKWRAAGGCHRLGNEAPQCPPLWPGPGEIPSTTRWWSWGLRDKNHTSTGLFNAWWSHQTTPLYKPVIYSALTTAEFMFCHHCHGMLNWFKQH